MLLRAFAHAQYLFERIASCCLPLRRVCSAADTVCVGPVAFSIRVSRRRNASFSRACGRVVLHDQGHARPPCRAPEAVT